MKITEKYIKERVISILYRVLDITDITDSIELDQDLITDLGSDSLDMIEIEMAIEKEFGINLDGDKPHDIRTVKDLINFIESVLNNCGYEYNTTKDEIPETEIKEYTRLHSKFNTLSQNIFAFAQSNRNTLNYAQCAYTGFYMSADGMVITYTSTQDTDEKSELTIKYKYLLEGTWRDYISGMTKKAWTCLDRDMKEHLKSRYESLKPKYGEKLSEYQRGQIELMESIYGKTNLN